MGGRTIDTVRLIYRVELATEPVHDDRVLGNGVGWDYYYYDDYYDDDYNDGRPSAPIAHS